MDKHLQIFSSSNLLFKNSLPLLFHKLRLQPACQEYYDCNHSMTCIKVMETSLVFFTF